VASGGLDRDLRNIRIWEMQDGVAAGAVAAAGVAAASVVAA